MEQQLKVQAALAHEAPSKSAISPFRPRVDPLADAARKALTLEEAEKLLEQLSQLCVSKGDDTRPLDEIAQALRDAGYKPELAQVLREALASPDVHPHVGALWMRRIITSKRWNHRYPDGMDQMCRRGEVGHQAVIEFLENVGAKRKAALVQRALRTHAKWLRTHPTGWGVAARALVNTRSYGKAVRWMSGWRARQDMDLPLLYCLIVALRGAGREKEAHEVVQLALAKPGADQQFPMLKLWYALEEALAGNTQVAATAFRDVKPIGWENDPLCLYYLTRGVIRVQQADEANRKEAFAAAYERIEERFKRHPAHSRDVRLRRQYRRCLQRMAHDSGSLGHGFLATWRSADSWPFLIPLLVIPGLQLFAPLYLLRLCTRRKGREE